MSTFNNSPVIRASRVLVRCTATGTTKITIPTSQVTASVEFDEHLDIATCNNSPV